MTRYELKEIRERLAALKDTPHAMVEYLQVPRLLQVAEAAMEVADWLDSTDRVGDKQQAAKLRGTK